MSRPRPRVEAGVNAGDLAVAYADEGPRDGAVALLLHGWPDDASTWNEVCPALHAAGIRTIVPTLRARRFRLLV